MRLVVCCFKGGVGKTTLSLNLAALFASQHRVLVNDRDPHCCSVAWAALSDETPFTVGRSASPGFDLEIQDLPPSAPVKDQLPDGDLYIVPTLLDGGSYVVYCIPSRPSGSRARPSYRWPTGSTSSGLNTAGGWKTRSWPGPSSSPSALRWEASMSWGRPSFPCAARAWLTPEKIYCG